MALLFLHGAGGYEEDRPLADAIAAELERPMTYPRFPDDDMSFDHQASLVRAALKTIRADDVVAAHSFGASILLRVLAERERETPRRVVLLAMPDWSPQGWDVANYAFTGPAPRQDISLHHCRHDDVVEFAHLALHAARLPRAAVHAHDDGGHQFEGLAAEIARDLART